MAEDGGWRMEDGEKKMASGAASAPRWGAGFRSGPPFEEQPAGQVVVDVTATELGVFAGKRVARLADEGNQVKIIHENAVARFCRQTQVAEAAVEEVISIDINQVALG